jgi:hypothetical protein
MNHSSEYTKLIFISFGNLEIMKMRKWVNDEFSFLNMSKTKLQWLFQELKFE